MPPHESVSEGYIGYISAEELIKLVSHRGEDGSVLGLNKSVFFDNIRDYNPSSKINKEIISSLRDDGSANFVYRNNGITVVAKSVDRTGNSFNIEDFQVVNGCQTSSVLFYNKDVVDGVNVPFRLIATDDDDFIFSIISGTNKQNAVKEEQFWALLPFMKNLEEYSRSEDDDKHIYLERRENQYRMDAVERARIISIQPFLKGIAATLLDHPHRAARDYRSEIKDNADIIFADNEDVRPAYAVAYLHYRMEFLWRNQKAETSSKIYRFYLMHAAVKSVLGCKRFLSLSIQKKQKFAAELVKLASKSDALPKLMANVEKILDEELTKVGAKESREKLRDTIRSESFFTTVSARYSPIESMIG